VPFVLSLAVSVLALTEPRLSKHRALGYDNKTLHSAECERMFLEAKKIPEIQRLLDGPPEEIEKIRGAEISLTIALFMALAHRSAQDQANTKLAHRIAELDLPGVGEAIHRLEPSGTQLSREPFGSPSFDLYRIGSKQDLLSPEWSLFYDRFRRSASNGRKGITYRAVGGVLGEMGDNVVSHAFESEDKPCAAIAGFHLTGDTACFCVADSGQGFLRSLRRSPAWSALHTDQQALEAVVNKHATSRPGECEGGGFKQLINSLLDFNGLVVLRSGSCTLRLENCREVRHVTTLNALHVPGSIVTVAIARRGKPSEQPLDAARK